MFIFIYDIMDLYYQKKLIAISNHQFDTYIALRFQGLNANKVGKEDIVSSTSGWYQVRCLTERSKFYDVNINIGICSCDNTQDGSPCIHQAAVIQNFGIESLNFICTLSASARLKIATIALGRGAVNQLSFYASLHQQAQEEQYKLAPGTEDQCTDSFEGPKWNLVRSNDDHFECKDVRMEDDKIMDIKKLKSEVDDFAKDLKSLISVDNQQLYSGIVKFLQRYKAMSGYRSAAKLASAFHHFGTILGGSVSRANMKGGVCHGKRIAVQATAAGRRRGRTSHGKSKIPAGRLCSSYSFHSSSHTSDVRVRPGRKEAKGKRAHSLQRNISKGQQNAGKW